MLRSRFFIFCVIVDAPLDTIFFFQTFGRRFSSHTPPLLAEFLSLFIPPTIILGYRGGGGEKGGGGARLAKDRREPRTGSGAKPVLRKAGLFSPALRSTGIRRGVALLRSALRPPVSPEKLETGGKGILRERRYAFLVKSPQDGGILRAEAPCWGPKSRAQRTSWTVGVAN